MRIISGVLRGRVFKRPDTSKVRPMTEKERAALFDILGDVQGLSVLDAYAGSGAIGLEALSRGAGRVEGVEMSRLACRIIQDNIRSLGLEFSYQLNCVSVEDWHKRYPLKRFDVIIAAPPFADLSPVALSDLGTHLVDTGVMAVSYSSRLETPEIQGLRHIDTRKYGDGSIAFYKHGGRERT